MVKGTVVALVLGFAMVTGAQAGCLTGAMAGGVVGHLAGHHGVAGAAVGCAVGHHRAKEKRMNQANQNQDDQNASH